MRDPYAPYNPYTNNFNAFYNYRNPYTQTPAFAYAKASEIKHYNYLDNKHRAELIEAGAGLGLTGAGAALATGKISAGLVGAKLAAAGLAIGSGGMIPLIGAIATLGAGALAGAVGLRTAQILGKKGVEGLEYLGERAFVNAGKLSNAAAKILATTAIKGTKASLKFTQKVTNAFLNKSKQALTKNMQQPTNLLQNFSKNQEAEKIFMDRLKTISKALDNKKDIKEDLKDMFKYRIPSQRAAENLGKLTTQYFLTKDLKLDANAKLNGEFNNKIDLKKAIKDFRKFAKEAGLNKKETKFFESYIPKQLEELRENLIVTKDNTYAPFKINLHKSIQQIAQQKSQKTQQKFEKNQQKQMQIKDKEQGKQQMQQQLQQNQKTNEKENTGFGR